MNKSKLFDLMIQLEASTTAFGENPSLKNYRRCADAMDELRSWLIDQVPDDDDKGDRP